MYENEEDAQRAAQKYNEETSRMLFPGQASVNYYEPRKIRNTRLYGVWREVSYYEGTFNAPVSGWVGY